MQLWPNPAVKRDRAKVQPLTFTLGPKKNERLTIVLANLFLCTSHNGAQIYF